MVESGSFPEYLRVPGFLDHSCLFPSSSLTATNNKMSQIASYINGNPPDNITIRPHADLQMNKLLCNNIDLNLPSPRIPNEILDHIIEIALWIAVVQAPYSNIFPVIASFTLASTNFRQIALRRFFNTVILCDTEQWNGLFKLLESQERKKAVYGGDGGFAWVRSVYAHISFCRHLGLTCLSEHSGRPPKSYSPSRVG